LSTGRLRATVDELKGSVGGMVLERWGFPEELVECANQCDNWSREHKGEADLSDLVITASLHAAIGRRQVPRVDQVTACQRLLGDEMCPEFAKQFLEGAQQEIDQARALVNG